MIEGSTDRKVTPIARRGSSGKWTPLIKNTYGIPAKYCANRTQFCDAHCYAEKIEKHRPAVRNLLERNWESLESHLDDYDYLYRELDMVVAEAAFMFKRHGILRENWVFRHFWDGDIPSLTFAHVMRDVALAYPTIRFWVYTRNFDMVPALSGATNFQVYLSVDNFNVWEARACEQKNRWVNLAFCADTWGDTLKLADKFPHRRRGPRCPEITKKIPLVVEGPEPVEIGQGACVECGLCIKGVNNVRFAAKNK